MALTLDSLVDMTQLAVSASHARTLAQGVE